MRFPNPITFLRACFRFARRPEIAPDHVVVAREDRCHRCPYAELTDLGWQCQVCTCSVNLKVLLATEKCPKNEWGEYFNETKRGL